MATREENPKPKSKSIEEDEDEEEEEDSTESSSPKQPQLNKTIPQPSQSSSEEESDSDSDSVSESRVLAIKHPSKPNTEPTIPIKRGAEEKQEGESKKIKIAPEFNTNKSSNKKLPFERLFTEKDELTILKGVINYTTEKDSSAITDFEEFHEFIKKDLDADVTKAQLHNKLRKIRQKYDKNVINNRRLFKNVHEQQRYDLSRRVWGDDEKGKGKMAIEAVKSDHKDDKSHLFGYNKMHCSHGLMSWEEKMCRIGSILFEGANDTLLEGGKEWTSLLVKDMEIFHDSLNVSLKKTELVMNELKKRC